MGNSPSINNVAKDNGKLIFKRTDNSTAAEIDFDPVSILSAEVDSKGMLTLKKTNGTSDGPFNVRGPRGFSIESGNIDEEGNLTFKRSDSTTIGPFKVTGKQGIQGTGIEKTEYKDGSLNIYLSDGSISKHYIKPDDIVDATYEEGFLSFLKTSGDRIGPFYMKPEDGKNGVGISQVNINASGEMTITLQDNTEFGPFKVRGSQGIQGVAGVPGKDGVGIAFAEYNNSGLILKKTDGTTEGPFNIRGPSGATGSPGIGIINASVDETGYLNITTSDQKNYGPFYVVGPKGDQGSKGDPGIQGLPSTIPGPRGEVGPRGPSGLDSQVPGPMGAQGIQGNIGPQGIQGIRGEKGEAGPQGIQGVKGDTGPQGIQGVKGDPGSPYFIRKYSGNNGTVPCNEYCRGGWEGWGGDKQAVCVGAWSWGAGGNIGCGAATNRQTDCYCINN